MPNFAAYGAVLSIIDETCRCYNGIRGQAAHIPYQEVVEVDKAERLSTTPFIRKVSDTSTALPESPYSLIWKSSKGFAYVGPRQGKW